MIPFDPNIILNILKKPKKYITRDKSTPPPPLAQLVEIKFRCENRPVILYSIITIIVGTKTTRFPINDPNSLDYMIHKLNTETPSIANHRENVKAYVFYKTAQKRIKTHELNIIKKIIANKKKRSKNIIKYSVVDPETYEMILQVERETQITKEANTKETTRKKDESAKKKVITEVKKKQLL